MPLCLPAGRGRLLFCTQGIHVQGFACRHTRLDLGPNTLRTACGWWSCRPLCCHVAAAAPAAAMHGAMQHWRASACTRRARRIRTPCPALQAALCICIHVMGMGARVPLTLSLNQPTHRAQVQRVQGPCAWGVPTCKDLHGPGCGSLRMHAWKPCCMRAVRLGRSAHVTLASIRGPPHACRHVHWHAVLPLGADLLAQPSPVLLGGQARALAKLQQHPGGGECGWSGRVWGAQHAGRVQYRSAATTARAAPERWQDAAACRPGMPL